MTQKYTKLNAITPKKILFFIGLFTFLHTYSQSYTGLQQSNYGGIHQSNLNPANITGTRHKFHVNVFTMGLGFNNDYLKLDMPFSVVKLLTGNVPDQYHQDNNPNNPIAFQDAWFTENLNGKPKNMNIYDQIKFPGVMVSLPKGFAVGVQYKNTISFQINNMSEPLARLMRYGVDSVKGSTLYSGPTTYNIGQNFADNAFTINMNMYGSWAFTVAKTLIQDDNMVLKAGVTGKYLMGYGTGYIKNNGIEFRTYGYDSIAFGKADIEYGYTDRNILKTYDAINLDMMVKKPEGAGFGYDLGATFEYKPDLTKRILNKKTNYLFRVGLSLLDGGKINYKTKVHTTHITNKTGAGFKVGRDYMNAWENGLTSGLPYTDSTLRSNFNIDTSGTRIQTTMPTSLNLQFDYNVAKNFYIGANVSQDVRGKQKIGIRTPSSLMVIPRFESDFIEISAPIGLMNDYKMARLGMYFRIGPLFIGSDNIIGLLKANNFYGADFYFGISTGILNKPKKNKGNQDQNIK